MIMATLVQFGSVFQATDGRSTNGIKWFKNGITCVLMAPIESLNMLEKVKIVMKAGTAQGKRKITPKIRLPLIKGW